MDRPRRSRTGRDDEKIGPECIDLRRDPGLGALTESDGEDDRSYPDEDPKRGERRAQSALDETLYRGA